MSEASTGLPPTARSAAELPSRRPERSDSAEERLFVASQWRLMWLKFRRHKVALVGVAVTVLFYLLAAFCEVVAPYDPRHRHGRHTFVPPQAIHFYDSEGGFSLRPFVYKLERHIDPRSLRRTYTEDRSQRHYVKLLHRGQEYRWWGLFDADVHLFGVDDEATIFLLVPVREYRIWTDVGSRGSWSARTEPVTDRESVADSLEVTTPETLLVVEVSRYMGSIGR